MATSRKFCRFNRQPETDPFSMAEIPPSGFCLSAFLVITQHGGDDRVLMGKLDPSADWEHIGALDRSRVLVHSRGWMLPSSHLIYKEAPLEAARRVLSEQLGIADLELTEPSVISYVDSPRRFPGLNDHWDLEFIFRGELDADLISQPTAWRELRLVDLSQTPRTEMARSHEDILESLGFEFGKV